MSKRFHQEPARALSIDERKLKLHERIADSCRQLSAIPEQWRDTVCVFPHPEKSGYECRLFMEKREIKSPQEEWYLVVSVEYVSYYYAMSVHVDHFPVVEMQAYLLKEETWQEVMGDIAMLVERTSKRGDD